MKLTVLLMLVFTLNLSAKGFGQGKNISMSVEGQTVRDIFGIIEKESDYRFFYNDDFKDIDKTIDIEAEDLNINQFLDQLLASTDFGYKVLENNLIVLTLKDNSQQYLIKGRITDESGEPLVGVTVTIKGTYRGVVSDYNGEYSIQADNSQSVLVFSFVSMTTQEIEVGNRSTINVVMKEDVYGLEEVVVVGYGTQKRSEVTASIASVSSDDFISVGTKSAIDLLQGKVSGLVVTRTDGNDPRSSSSIQIRGVSSLSASTEPLIVIDGVPGGNLDLLQQDDIESFDVLKDGSAAAIYGTRGTNGVILITTKKGKSGEAKFDFSTYVQRETVAVAPDILTAGEYRELMADPNNPYSGLMHDYGASTDWYNLLINEDNLSTYNNFAMSGGSDKTNYRASIFYREDEPIAIESEKKQYGGRINVNTKGLNNKLTTAFNMSSNFGKPNNMLSNGDFEQAVQRNPTMPLYNEDGTYYETTGFNDYNPVSKLNQQKSYSYTSSFMSDITATLNIVTGLKASIMGALQKSDVRNNQYISKESKTSLDTYSGGGYASKGYSTATNRTLEVTIDYNTTIKQSHSINAIAGYSYQDNTNENFSASNAGFISDAFEDNNLANGTALGALTTGASVASGKSSSTLIAFFVRANYAYKGKYQASFTLRHEGSSKFGLNEKWGNFPAASFGWVISEENFMRNVSFINNLKLRYGYGVTGNQGFDSYRSLITFSSGASYPVNGVWTSTFGPANNPNTELRWEKKVENNIGLDFTIFNNKLRGTVEYYHRLTKDALFNYNAQLPPFVQPTIFTNVGSISNQGIEVTLHSTVAQKSDFSWNVDLTFTTQKNKLVSLSNDDYKASYQEFGNLPSPGALGYAIRTVEGGSLGEFYGKRFAGFTEDGKWQFYKADGTIGASDEMADEDLTTIGNGIPKYIASFSNIFTYKNFDLTIFFRGKFDYDILNLKELYFGNMNWLPMNILQTGATSELRESPQYSDYYLEPGGFVKLDNINLAYNFNIKSSYIRYLKVYVSGKNIATMTKYSGLDPEVQDTGTSPGIDGRSFYPRTRTFTIGLNLGF